MRFWKMNGAGNDFIIINNIKEKIAHEKFPLIAKKLCDRHMSIGADGFMAVENSEVGDFRMMFYNPDGTEGEMCGNGARCICRYGTENGLAGERQYIETVAGMVAGYRIDRRKFRIRLNDPSIVKLNIPIEFGGKTYSVSYVELGNPGIPHAVVNIPGLKNVTFDGLRELGRALRYYDGFSKGANVNFYDIEEDGSITEKTYERGVEEFTYSCGTGTGSVAVCLAIQRKESLKDVRVHVPGGELFITVDMDREIVRDIWLTGPTNIVCKGEVTDEELCI